MRLKFEEHGLCVAEHGRPPASGLFFSSSTPTLLETGTNESSLQNRPSTRQGFGLVATQPISRGTLVLEERPLFTSIGFASESDLVRKLRAKSQIEQDAINALCNSHPQLPLLVGIVKTNALPMGDTSAGAANPAMGVALFKLGCRINHSCTPNVNHHWHQSRGVETFFATRQIQIGEELSIYYYNPFSPRQERQGYLLNTFGSKCECETCVLPPLDAAASDVRRTAIQRAIDEIPRLTRSPEAIIKLVRQAFKNIDREGLVVGKGSLAYDAYQAAAAWKDNKNAIKWAKLSAECYLVETGDKSACYAMSRGYQAAPTSHRAYGMFGRRTVGGPE
ncbi:hypothetical protein P7C70_g6632, partial [Phenoliferia sp. Uapishka_3]